MLTRIDRFLASSLSAAGAPWPGFEEANPDLIRRRIDYHGIAPLLARQPLDNWPPDLASWVKNQARYWAMWELRHRAVVSGLLGELSGRRVPAVILKGTALAFDVYHSPDLRPRGDTDLLVSEENLPAAREALREQDFHADKDSATSDFDLQEIWLHEAGDGTKHTVDLHWRVLNSPALSSILDTAGCMASSRRLEGLGPVARTMDRPRLLLHACTHRACHITAPYFVDDRTYYGGERLIWACDIDLLARALTAPEWAELCRLAEAGGAAPVVLNGLEFAQRSLGTVIPTEFERKLKEQGTKGFAARYFLQSGQLSRNLADCRAIPGIGPKLSFALIKLFPSREFLRSKYPSMDRWPIIVLLLRRVLELFLNRPSDTRS